MTDGGRDLEIHRPKAPHSFREFLSEVGVIVVGIAIALLGEQAVEALHWRHEVSEARRSLNVEVGHDLDVLDYLIAGEPCVERRLAEAGGALGAPGAPPLRRPMGQPQFPNMPTEAWDVALASGAVAHMPAKTAQTYRVIYGNLAWIKARVDEERTDWAKLSVLDLGVPMTPAVQAELLPTLAHAKAVADKFAQNEPLAANGDSARATWIGGQAARVGASGPRGRLLGLAAASLNSEREFCEGR